MRAARSPTSRCYETSQRFGGVLAGRSVAANVAWGAYRALRPGGVIVIADEVRPRAFTKRLLQAVLRGPQAALAWVMAGSVSRPISDLAAELVAAGFVLLSERRWLLETLAVVIAERRQ